MLCTVLDVPNETTGGIPGVAGAWSERLRVGVGTETRVALGRGRTAVRGSWDSSHSTENLLLATKLLINHRSEPL